MGMQQSSKFCKDCGENVLAERPGTNHILHLILTVLTVGCWIIVWIGCCIRIGGWRCSRCGRKV